MPVTSTRLDVAADDVLIAAALRRAREISALPEPEFRMHADERRPEIGPVPLAAVIAAFNLLPMDVPNLTRAAAGAELHKHGLDFPELLEDVTPLAGFLYANAAGGLIMLRSDDPIARRRFSAAHELGHYLMHWQGQSEAAGAMIMDDEPQSVSEERPAESSCPESGTEAAPASADPSLEAIYDMMERQANRFAAELLIPEPVCRGAYDYYLGQGGSPRFVENHIATHLLVSRQAVRWRLESLGLAAM
jgi:Zn-dependent peptidase ImmA (M78 family)